MLYNDKLTKQILEDSPLTPVSGDVIEEGTIMADSIAFFPKLVTPADSLRARQEHNADNGEIDIHYTKDISDYVNKIYIQKRPSQFTSKVTENYLINVGSTNHKGQIQQVTEQEVQQELNESEVFSFTLECTKEFEVRSKSTVITEAIKAIPVIKKDWMINGSADEINIMRTFNTVLELNDIKIFDEDLDHFLPTMNWFLNSPYIKPCKTNVDSKLNEATTVSSSNYKQELIDNVQVVVDGIVAYNEDSEGDDLDDPITTFALHISDNIVSHENYVDNAQVDKALTMMNSLYNGFNATTYERSRLAETFHLLALFIYIKYQYQPKAQLIYMFPTDAEDVESYINRGELLVKYTDGTDDIIIQYINGEENQDRYLVLDSDYNGHTEIIADDENYKTLTITDIDETIADDLLHGKYDSMAGVIRTVFFNLKVSQDIFYRASPFNLTEEVLMEATANETKLKNKRNEIMNLIRKAYKHIDLDGSNLKQIESQYANMSDTAFMAEMKRFITDDERNFHLEVLPNKNEPSMRNIRDGLKAIKVPENEYIYMRHFEGTESNPIRTRHENTVGYLHIKRLQQMLSKKNSYSLDIKARNVKTMQVTASDKVARISDLESSSLMAIGAELALKEFMSSRADDMGSKNQLYSDINTFGYAKLADMPDDLDDKVTLNTINNYLIAAGVDNDLKVDDRLIKELNKL